MPVLVDTFDFTAVYETICFAIGRNRWTNVKCRIRKTYECWYDIFPKSTNWIVIDKIYQLYKSWNVVCETLLRHCSQRQKKWVHVSLSRSADPDNKVHGANMGPTWVLSAPDGPHVGPMNLAMRRNLAPVVHLHTHGLPMIYDYK